MFAVAVDPAFNPVRRSGSEDNQSLSMDWTYALLVWPPPRGLQPVGDLTRP
jgi:hypothetical protein